MVFVLGRIFDGDDGRVLVHVMAKEANGLSVAHHIHSPGALRSGSRLDDER